MKAASAGVGSSDMIELRGFLEEKFWRKEDFVEDCNNEISFPIVIIIIIKRLDESLQGNMLVISLEDVQWEN